MSIRSAARRIFRECRHGTRRTSCGTCMAAEYRAVTIGYAPSTETPNPEGVEWMLRQHDELFADDEAS